jgi:hypothetical protein
MYGMPLFDPDEVPAELLDCFEEVETVCGAPWERVTEVTRKNYTSYNYQLGASAPMGGGIGKNFPETTRNHKGFRPTCTHDAPTRPCIVLDPFAGSGTSGLVARQLGRHFVGLDLSFTYLRDNARDRLGLNALEAWTKGIRVEETADLGPLFDLRRQAQASAD